MPTHDPKSHNRSKRVRDINTYPGSASSGLLVSMLTSIKGKQSAIGLIDGRRLHANEEIGGDNGTICHWNDDNVLRSDASPPLLLSAPALCAAAQ